MLRIVGTCDRRLFGITPAERLRRQRRSAPGPVLVAHASAVLSDAAVQWLLENPGRGLATPSGRLVAIAVEETGAPAAEAAVAAGSAPESVNPAALPAMFIRKLRRRDTLFVRSLEEEPRPNVERELFANVYKGVTDLVTKFAWPAPAFWVTRLCAALRIRPNAVTLLGILCMTMAAYYWVRGDLVTGMLLAWLMTFLDTVDGKLARVTVTSSKFGDKLDHWTDVVHPPIWWVCLAVGLAKHHSGAVLAISLAAGAILAGYVLGRIIEVIFKLKFGYNPYLWQRFDSAFRLIVSRRNIILLIMTAGLLVGAPVEAFIASAVWTAVSVVIQVARLVQAMRTAGDGELKSWLM